MDFSQPPDPLAVKPAVAGLYSASGFDLLGVLARVAARPFPQIAIGPVDTSCSFLVVDAKQFDCPIIYASDTFSKLTGSVPPPAPPHADPLAGTPTQKSVRSPRGGVIADTSQSGATVAFFSPRRARSCPALRASTPTRTRRTI